MKYAEHFSPKAKSLHWCNITFGPG